MAERTPRSLSRRRMLQVTAGTAAGAGLAGLARGGEDPPGAPARPASASSMIGVPFEKHCLREGFPPDMDVYDLATWCAPAPLSELSVAQRSTSVPFPDFTRGGWSGERA